jgi:hypothetical protein
MTKLIALSAATHVKNLSVGTKRLDRAVGKSKDDSNDIAFAMTSFLLPGAAMSFEVACPSCQKSYAAEERLIGKRIRCRQCSNTFTVEPTTASSASTAGRSSSSVIKALNGGQHAATATAHAATASAGVATASPPVRRAVASKPSTVDENGWRPSVPQEFPFSEVLEAWLPLVLALFPTVWVPADSFFGNRSGTMWAPVLRIAAFFAAYLLLAVPLTKRAIEKSFTKMHRMLPPSPWQRVAVTFAIPATLIYVFAMFSGIVGFIIGCLLGLAIAAVVYWLMFRLTPEEAANSYALASSTFTGSAVGAMLVLMGLAFGLNKALLSSNATDGIHDNPLGPQFVWVVPPPPAPAALEPGKGKPSPSDSVAMPQESTPSQPTAPAVAVVPPVNSEPAVSEPPTSDPKDPAAPLTVTSAGHPNDSKSEPIPQGPLFETDQVSGESDEFVASIVNAKLPWVRAAYRPTDEGYFEQSINAMTPSPFVGLVRIPGIDGRTIECCRLTPTYRGLGSLPLGGDASGLAGSSGRVGLAVDGSALLRLTNADAPQVEVAPFTGLGSIVRLVVPDGYGKTANNGSPVAPELLGAIPAHRFLIRWSTPERSALQVYDFHPTDGQPSMTIQIGYSDFPGVFSVSSDGNWFAMVKQEADGPLAAIFSLTDRTRTPALLPLLSSRDGRQRQVTGIAFSPDSTKVAVLLEQGTSGIVRAWTVSGEKPLAEGTCTVPSADEMLGQAQGRTIDWLTNENWLVHGRVVMDANKGTTVATLTGEVATGQQLADDHTAYLTYMGRDRHPHLAVLKFNPAILKASTR